MPQVGIPQVKMIDCKFSYVSFIQSTVYTAGESQVNSNGKHNSMWPLYAVPGKIVMSKVSKAAQKTSQLKH